MRLKTTYKPGNGDLGYTRFITKRRFHLDSTGEVKEVTEQYIELRKDDPIVSIYQNATSIRLKIYEILKLTENDKLRTPELIENLNTVATNCFSFSAFCHMLGNSSRNAVTEESLNQVIEAEDQLKKDLKDAPEFIDNKDCLIGIYIEQICELVRELESNYIQFKNHPELIRMYYELIEVVPELQQEIMKDVNRMGSYFNRLSKYLFQAVRYELYLRCVKETYWNGESCNSKISS